MKIEPNLLDYLRKWRANPAEVVTRVGHAQIFWSWLGAFTGIGAIALLEAQYLNGYGLSLMIGSFGASAVLLYGVPKSPLAQPRNLVGGHIVSALVGVACWQLFHAIPGLAQALAVSTAIVLMHYTRTLHPPGGATAMIATLGVPEIQHLGFWFVLMPATVGPLILLVVALVVNNLPRSRRYPEHWW